MKIYILGCGALGSNIAMNLAFDAKDHHLVLVDFDIIEARNYQFGTQQYTPSQICQKKVDALMLKIIMDTRRPFSDLSRLDKKLNIDKIEFEKDSLLVDCLDNYTSRLFVKTEADRLGLECVHVGFSPAMTFEAGWNDNYSVPDDTLGSFDICEAQGARSFIQYVAGLATNIIVDFLKKGDKLELVGNRFNVTKIE